MLRVFRQILCKNPTRLLSSEHGTEPSFAKMFYESKFVQMGDPNGAIVKGRIVHIMEDDLYIDFGGKFNCVCKRPQRNAQAYRRGVEVRLRLQDFELSSRFLGSNKDITLLEADATLLGLASRPEREKPAFPTSRRRKNIAEFMDLE